MDSKYGVILAAYGQKYIDEGQLLVESIRYHMPDLPITLVTDQVTVVPDNWVDCLIRIGADNSSATGIDAELQNTMNSLISDAPKLKGWLFKVWAMSHSPYEYSLFLDMDTILGYPINDIFHLLTRFDVMVGYAPTKTPAARFCNPIEDLKNHVAVPRINTGVVAYSRKAVEKDFFSDWLQRLIVGIKRGAFKDRPKYGDQSEFHPLVWNSSVSILVLPVEYHLRVGNTTTLEGPVRILHGRPRGTRKRLIDFLNSTHEKRIWLANEGMRKSSDQYSSVYPYITQSSVRPKKEVAIAG